MCSSDLMRLPNEADKAIVRGAVAESSGSIVSFLSSLANREAIAFGEAIPTPMRMRFGEAPKRLTVAEQRAMAEPISSTGILKIVSRLRGEAGGEQ